jgi:hypothetical protein
MAGRGARGLKFQLLIVFTGHRWGALGYRTPLHGGPPPTSGALLIEGGAH